jgi:hypothetical protein
MAYPPQAYKPYGSFTPECAVTADSALIDVSNQRYRLEIHALLCHRGVENEKREIPDSPQKALELANVYRSLRVDLRVVLAVSFKA